MAKAAKPKSVSRKGYGIVYKNGEFWSRDRFDTPESAKDAFDAFWRLPGFDKPPPWSDYTVVKVRQSLTYTGPA